MPVHHLLEEILNEYIAAAGLQSGQPLFQSVNSVGTAVTGPSSTLPSPTLAMLGPAQIPGPQAAEDSFSELPNKLAVY